VRNHIDNANAACKGMANKHRKKMEFSPRDLLWLHLRKERFPSRRKNELMARGNGPFKIIGKVGDNAYKLQLPGMWLLQSRSTLVTESLCGRLFWRPSDL